MGHVKRTVARKVANVVDKRIAVPALDANIRPGLKVRKKLNVIDSLRS